MDNYNILKEIKNIKIKAWFKNYDSGNQLLAIVLLIDTFLCAIIFTTLELYAFGIPFCIGFLLCIPLYFKMVYPEYKKEINKSKLLKQVDFYKKHFY